MLQRRPGLRRIKGFGAAVLEASGRMRVEEMYLYCSGYGLETLLLTSAGSVCEGEELRSLTALLGRVHETMHQL